MPVLPTFIIAGERRCGTTTLFDRLRGHPGVFLPVQSDINYFIENEIERRQWRDGETDADGWARTHSRDHYSRLFDGAGLRRAVGHKGSDLLFWRPAHQRIIDFVPEIRLVVTLRDPVSRAWSHYWNEVGKGREHLGFEEALAVEAERTRRSAYARLHLSYLQRGHYADSLEVLFETVPPDRVKVITLEESRLRPDRTYEDVLRFLGVEPAKGGKWPGEARNENWTMVPRDWARRPTVQRLERLYNRVTEGTIVRVTSDADTRRRMRRRLQAVFRTPAARLKMPDELRAHLRAQFAGSTDRLGKLLNRSFDEWNGPS